MSALPVCSPQACRAGRLTASLLVVTLWPLGLSAPVAVGEIQLEAAGTADQLVYQALLAEASGSTNRQTLLQAALTQSPNHAPARWQSGYVEWKKQWVHIDQMPAKANENRNLPLYLGRRNKSITRGTWNTVEGQRDLAKACAKWGLTDQKRAHLTRLLELAPEDPTARQELGYLYLNGRWMDSQETKQLRARADRENKAMAKWLPELQDIRRGLEGRNEPLAAATSESKRQPSQSSNRRWTQEEAKQQWEMIDDPAAIPAMEAVFSGSNQPRWALTVIEKLSKMKSPEAAISLARHAMLTPAQHANSTPSFAGVAGDVFGFARMSPNEFAAWSEVHQKAVAALQSRPREQYVPALLSILHTPVVAHAWQYQARDGGLLHQLMFYREGQEQRNLLVNQTAYRPLHGPNEKPQLTSQVTAAAAERERLDAQRLVAQQNMWTEAINRQACAVLAAATGEASIALPEKWWQWWNEYNEVYVLGDKPIQSMYIAQNVPVRSYAPQSPRMASAPTQPRPARPLRRFDCLAAGTLVWTDTGPVPIEQITVGDRVLSQDVESGELTYKPVLGTTTRPEGNLVRMAVAGESFQASGGHRFWVAGRGWVKARDIETGSLLHGTTTAAKVQATSDGDTEKTYNLLVADFHTYFVGRARILSHDNTLAQATDVLVPGLKDH